MAKNRHARDDALDKFLLLDLYRGALRIEDRKKRLIACYLILVCGRLGMRIGEALHLHQGWIDWQRGYIEISDRDPCGCRYCWRAAERKAGTILDALDEEGSAPVMTVHDPFDSWGDVLDQGLPDSLQKSDRREFTLLEIVLYSRQWEPKTEMSARVIPFNFSTRIGTILATVQKELGVIDENYQYARRALSAAAEKAEHLDENDVGLHSLRATAETWWADIDIDKKARRDLGGWEQDRQAWRYSAQSPGILSDKIREALDMEPLEIGGVDFLVVDERPIPGEPFDLHALPRLREDLMAPHDPGPVHNPRTPYHGYKDHDYVYEESLQDSHAIQNGPFTPQERRRLIEGYLQVDINASEEVENPWPTVGQPSSQTRWQDWLGIHTVASIAASAFAIGLQGIWDCANRQYLAWTGPHLNDVGEPYEVSRSSYEVVSVATAYLGVVVLYLLLLEVLGIRLQLSTMSVYAPPAGAAIFIVTHLMFLTLVHLYGLELQVSRTDPVAPDPFDE